MELQKISFSLAKLLMEKGFYIETQNKRIANYNLPSLDLVIKWLRKTHNINIFIDSVGSENGYFYILQNVLTGNQITTQDCDRNTYEQAQIEAIKKVLTLI